MAQTKLRETLLALECELLLVETRHSEARLRELLADEFVEFGSSGRIYNKQSIIDSLLRSESTENFQIDDFRLVISSDRMAFVTYSCAARSGSGEILRKSNRSSLWKLKDGRWQIVFNQGTRTQ